MIIYFKHIDNESQKDTFTEIYNTYKQSMYYEANLILNDKELSKDAVHEAFIKILHNLDKIDDIHCPKTKAFVTIIVKRVSINIYNKRKRESIMDINDLENEMNFSPSLLDQLDCFNSNLLLFNQLQPNDQEIIILKYIYGFSISEISPMLEISEDALYKRFQRCKNKLRKAYFNHDTR
ncbi:sigma-70 family RNA polymerase sigma factor [Terrisporobacter petrolearius]|uniref:RNA polymerase sigma factor n=1 Tax=Terrisporobacter petrolearius TaxID=1460447 RepID=UPI001D160FB9|nr:sigma-70 family RNA polymerase sigma factor [Terrisporobacter petrolearius]MCC3863443.1 sigma-70 family RNA polymerase sigma factor [Terrisporobacter petrolearius]